MRTGMESVYTLLNVDRGVPEVWGSKYDVRELLRACYYAIDKKPLSEAELNFGERELGEDRAQEDPRHRRRAAAQRERPHRIIPKNPQNTAAGQKI